MGVALAASALASALLFALYVLAFYAGSAADGHAARWNDQLPRLYESGTPAANAGIGLHFAAGGLILVLGGVQLVPAVGHDAPAVHRWAGRVYVTASLLAGLGGPTLIILNGTVGGTPMDVGFGLYGVLTVVAAVETVRHARAGRTAPRRMDAHRVWGLRLFALAIGSWLYRMDFGVWMTATGGAGHTTDFRGPFDIAMAFWFYLPNLFVADAFSRARRVTTPPALRLAAAGVLAVATGVILLGTYYFTARYSGPAIVRRLLG
ncbi:hypothetical protein tb265_46710 [Gemmatimonadetes bacterium T265]|nr:hypothetical protein tb265_46710 [Gemmatimonadetes bacterium T265]